MPEKGAEGLQSAVEQLCHDAEKAVDEGKNYIILSDRGIEENIAPIPSLTGCICCSSSSY